MNTFETKLAIAKQMGMAAKATFQNAADNQEIPDSDIVACKSLFKPWIVDETVKPGNCRTYNDKVYRVRDGKGHTTQADWTPVKTPDLWVVIDIEHAGTMEDPIPASRGMEYEYGKYYLDPEDEKIYICNGPQANQEKPNNLQYLPHELVGHFFNLAE